jgi:hypothetical protein
MSQRVRQNPSLPIPTSSRTRKNLPHASGSPNLQNSLRSSCAFLPGKKQNQILLLFFLMSLILNMFFYIQVNVEKPPPQTIAMPSITANSDLAEEEEGKGGPVLSDLMLHKGAYYAIFNNESIEGKEVSRSYKWQCNGNEDEGLVMKTNGTLVVKCDSIGSDGMITAMNISDSSTKTGYCVTDHIEIDSDESDYTTTSIPQHIFMLWASGWDKAPQTAKLCRKSWELQNPNHIVIALDLPHAEFLIDRKSIYPDAFWNPLTIQAKSDIIRVNLLHKFGGIWADASAFCNRPLLDWINHHHSSDFVSFLRNENPERKASLHIDPWYTSWFMVARKNSYVINEVFKVISNPDEFHRLKAEYFWLHRIVSELADRDDLFRSIVNGLPSADPSHCKSGSMELDENAKIWKRCNIDEWSRIVSDLEKH